MKFIFFAVTEYPGFRGSQLEKELRKCGAEMYVAGRGADLVVIKVENYKQEDCVKEVLNVADLWYFEMYGAPRSLYLMSPSGATKAEVEFR